MIDEECFENIDPGLIEQALIAVKHELNENNQD